LFKKKLTAARVGQGRLMRREKGKGKMKKGRDTSKYVDSRLKMPETDRKVGSWNKKRRG